MYAPSFGCPLVTELTRRYTTSETPLEQPLMWHKSSGSSEMVKKTEGSSLWKKNTFNAESLLLMLECLSSGQRAIRDVSLNQIRSFSPRLPGDSAGISPTHSSWHLHQDTKIYSHDGPTSHHKQSRHARGSKEATFWYISPDPEFL